MNEKYVQYGCGLSCPNEWLNYDSSPTLRLQKILLFGNIFKFFSKIKFPNNILVGDIVEGLPLKDNSVIGLYCSHILEHLSYNELIRALRNSYKILKNGGVFRIVLPDMEFYCRNYLKSIDQNSNQYACVDFMEATLLGKKERDKSFISFLKSFYGNSNHLWMWDYYSFSRILLETGFRNIKKCDFNDSKNKMFLKVEDQDRYTNCLSIEAIK